MTLKCFTSAGETLMIFVPPAAAPRTVCNPAPRRRTGKRGSASSPMIKITALLKVLKVLSGDLQQRRLLEPPVVLPAKRTEHRYDQEPGIVLQALVHGAVQVWMDHQAEQTADLPVRRAR